MREVIRLKVCVMLLYFGTLSSLIYQIWSGA